MMYYAAFKDNLVLLPQQLASVLTIGRFIFNSMLIEYSMSDGLIPTQLDGSTMAKAYDFLSTLYYAALKGNLVLLSQLVATMVQNGRFSFNSMLFEYLMRKEVIPT